MLNLPNVKNISDIDKVYFHFLNDQGNHTFSEIRKAVSIHQQKLDNALKKLLRCNYIKNIGTNEKPIYVLNPKKVSDARNITEISELIHNCVKYGNYTKNELAEITLSYLKSMPLQYFRPVLRKGKPNPYALYMPDKEWLDCYKDLPHELKSPIKWQCDFALDCIALLNFAKKYKFESNLKRKYLEWQSSLASPEAILENIRETIRSINNNKQNSTRKKQKTMLNTPFHKKYVSE